MAFGLLFEKLGYPWYFSGLSGLFIFAGSAQFLAVGLIAVKASLADIFLTTFILNLRHVFYGFSFLNRYLGLPLLKKAYLIFGLTDETYSVLTAIKSTDKTKDIRFCFYVTAINHLYWTLGCTLGGLLGENVDVDTKGYEFVLTALFVVLLIEQIKNVKKVFPILFAAVSALMALAMPLDRRLVSALLLSTLFLVFYSRRYKKEEAIST